ncbi:hypothetical protein HMPREF9248_0118 [Fannyhessea vaginae PB189-T1-4]|uniref:Uncharacterized protein n=1 Tax=Fannyhessea vaginae PB189-T1-4 TaxID=866774 RepID=A0ABP2J6A3_9ACTN|nr:hypothetical protein HMPREF9248_0118 [Fannyhessea vaginae PB189-T1-4]
MLWRSALSQNFECNKASSYPFVYLIYFPYHQYKKTEEQ